MNGVFLPLLRTLCPIVVSAFGPNVYVHLATQCLCCPTIANVYFVLLQLAYYA